MGDEGEDSAGWRRPDPALLVLRRGECLALLALPGAVAAGALVVFHKSTGAFGALVLAAVLTGTALIMVTRRFRAWGYLEREDDLLVRRGVLIRRTSVVPYGRMQFVDVTAGPLDRRFGLAAVIIHTAAMGRHATIPGLATAEATRLRDRLALLGEARAAGV